MGGALAVRLAIILLALVGLGVSTYIILFEHFGAPLVCLGEGCSIVAQSPYSEIFGVPVALLGFISYGLILALGSWSLRVENPLSDYLHLGVFGLALSGLIFSAYLMYVSFTIIQATCVWCLTSAAAITSIFVLAALGLRRAEGSD
jgi:uncharacterized membrane protein